MNKPIIFVDCDDVLIDLVGEWMKKLNEIYGTNYTANDVPDWDMSGLFPNIPKSDLLKPLQKAEIWHKMKPIEGAIKYLTALHDEGYEIYVLTATDYRNVRVKIESVITKYFPFIDFEHVIICHHKQLVGDENCILVDDYINNLKGGRYKKVLFTQPYNSELKLDKEIHRALDWENCYNIIHKLTKGYKIEEI